MNDIPRSKKSILVLTLIVSWLCLTCGAGYAQPARDLTRYPFTSNSPWNHPIGSNAVYRKVPGLNQLTLGLNYHDRWTCGVYLGRKTDRVGRLYFRSDMWRKLHQGLPNSGNPWAVEENLRQGARQTPPWPANYYSTVIPGSSKASWPQDFHRATDYYYSPTFYIPAGATPSPDSDGLMAIFQPNGWVLDCYATVVLANGDIVCGMASYVNARGEGTGWSNGRRASMLPSFAGLIRDGEISSGAIKHALVCQMSRLVLEEAAVWPAYAWDTNARYRGTLPMGALLAIPGDVDVNALPLTSKGKVLAKALQNYGVYVADRGGDGGMTILAELKAHDIHWPGRDNDLNVIKNYLRWVSNNSPENRGGGGKPRRPLLSDRLALPQR
jgi:hypothetical protein